MKSIRIGNDIRIEWPLRLSGDVENLKELDLCVEVVPSKEIIDYKNHHEHPCIKVETCTVMLNGGKCQQPSRDVLKAWHDRKKPEMSPIILPFTIDENKIIAIWKGDNQYSIGEYDIIVYSKKNDIGQSVADQCRFVRLVAHSAQADAPADSDVEAIITLQPLTLELSGLSAYDIAVAKGFKGTVEEWLASLKGAAGTGAEVVQETGNNEDAVMSQKATTGAIINTIGINELDFDLSKMELYMAAGAPCRFTVTDESVDGKKKYIVGVLDCFSDNSAHVFTQVFTTHYLLPFNGSDSDDKIYTYYRSYHIQEDTSSVSQGTWGEWTVIDTGGGSGDFQTITNGEIDSITKK